jgi:hypothetical protein
MSAFQVSPNHIGAILRWYLFDGCRMDDPRSWRSKHRADRDDAQEMAVCLALECYRSVSYRYSEFPTDLPGPIAFRNRPVVVNVRNLGVYRKLTAVECIKAVHCLEYQSCEHPEWNDSEARKLCQQIIDTAIRYLPGYDDAPWDIDDRAPNPVISLYDLTRK